jgi:hypothetical protein
MMHQLFTPLNLFLIGILLLVVGFGTFGVIAGKKDHPS